MTTKPTATVPAGTPIKIDRVKTSRHLAADAVDLANRAQDDATELLGDLLHVIFPDVTSEELTGIGVAADAFAAIVERLAWERLVRDAPTDPDLDRLDIEAFDRATGA